MIREIPLTQEKIALVDSQDYDKLRHVLWHAHKGKGTYYAVSDHTRTMTKGVRSGLPVAMHTMIMKTPPGYVVDHINGNGLDNRRQNLRILTREENSAGRTKGGMDKFRGVVYDKERGTWRASIKKGKRGVFLGRFEHQVDAAKAYDSRAKELFGELAVLNFMTPKDAMPVIALHGLQGSAKSTVAQFLMRRLQQYGFDVQINNIKYGFTGIAEYLLDWFSKATKESKTRLATPPAELRKQVYLLASTLGETLFDPMIWSRDFEERIKYTPFCYNIADDIRTEMNIAVLAEI